MSPNSVYLLHENLPEYGLAVHLYLEDHKIQRTSFSILKIVEKKGGILSVWHVREGSQADAQEIRRVYQMVTGRELTEPVIRAEYEL